MEHEYFMAEALKEAEKAIEHEDVPVGAVIVQGKRIIARAHNQVELLKDPTAHAEMIALTQAAATIGSQKLNECMMYVTLEPCSMCTGAAVLARIKTIFYAAADAKTGACGSVLDIANDLRLNHQIKVVHGLLREESKHLLQDFFQRLR